MERISAFFMALVAIFLSFFYGYNSTTAKYLQDGVDSATISNDKVSIEIVGDITESSDEINVIFKNHTIEPYKFNNKLDIEVLVNEKWYSLPQTYINHFDGSVFTIGGGESAQHTFTNINVFHIKSAGTYRIVAELTGNGGNITTVCEFHT